MALVRVAQNMYRMAGSCLKLRAVATSSFLNPKHLQTHTGTNMYIHTVIIYIAVPSKRGEVLVQCLQKCKAHTLLFYIHQFNGKSSITRKKTLFTSKLDLNLRKKLVKCYGWSTVLCDVQIWTLPKSDQKYLERFEMRCLRRLEKISWTDLVTNGEILHRVK